MSRQHMYHNTSHFTDMYNSQVYVAPPRTCHKQHMRTQEACTVHCINAKLMFVATVIRLTTRASLNFDLNSWQQRAQTAWEPKAFMQVRIYIYTLRILMSL